MGRVLAAVFGTAIALHAFGARAASPPALAGVWQGTIGGQPVRACFNEREFASFGLYYYASHLQTIALQQPENQPRVFVEGDDPTDSASPRWTFDTISADSVSGHWAKAGKSLPIELKRVAGVRLGEDETACGSMAFHARRLEGLQTIRKPATKDGLTYTRLILDTKGRFGESLGVETFALAGDSSAIRKINARLAQPLDTKRDDSWLACVRMAADSNPNGADDIESYEPRMATRRWLSVRDSNDSFCGGAHPESSSIPLLFDLTTGAEVDVFSWFNDKAIKREPVEGYAPLVSLRPAFRALVIGRWKTADSECQDAVANEEYWHAELTRTGFAFTPDLPHVVQACGEEFKVPFAKLQPYFSGEGRKQVAELQAEVAKR